MTRLARGLLAASASLIGLAAGLPVAAQTQSVLSILWQVKVGGIDYMSSTVASERNNFPVRGAVAYIPATSGSGKAPLYRLSTPGNHADSLTTNEGGYSLDGTLGYPWTSSTAVPGLAQLVRLWNGTGDHLTVIDGDSQAGYGAVDNFGLYAFPRFNNTGTVLNSLAAGGVTIASNSVSGGAVWSWVWNGIEFIKNDDYGELMQTAFFWYDNGEWYNPTEGGSDKAYPALANYAKQGSPVVANYNSGNTQITSAVPLEWRASTFGGGLDNPVIYADMKIGKEVTLNYNNMGPVAQYVTNITTPSAVAMTSYAEIPTGHLRSSFTKFYTYDASSQTLTQVFPSSCTNAHTSYTPPSGYGGVIIANNAGTAAMGVYGRATSAPNGYVSEFRLWNFLSCMAVSKWSALSDFGTKGAGTTTYKTWVTSDTLSNVQAHMRQLYVDGAY